MSQISIDQQAVSRTCDHCHEAYDVSRGSVYDDGRGYAVYLVAMHKCHSGRLVHLAIGVREGYKGFPETCAVTMQVWATESDFEMSLVDAKDSPWQDESYLGRMMNREEALSSSLIGTFFDTADHVVTDTPQVTEYLSSG